MSYIMINEKVRINCSDHRSYVPEVLRVKKETNEEYWKGYGYFSSLKLAVDKIIELELFKEEANMTLKQFIANFNRVKEELINSTCEKIEKSKNS